MAHTRRYDLDWLRVGVFALLIFYHVGMFFVPWGWHIKNDIIVKTIATTKLDTVNIRIPRAYTFLAFFSVILTGYLKLHGLTFVIVRVMIK